VALAPPRLDDRGYLELRTELVRRIPVHSPEWTDHNATDPGIALVDLFAFLGDNLLYRLNRVPEASRLAFLRLLNILPRPARAALAQVRLELQAGNIEPDRPDFIALAPRLQVSAGSVLFQALEEITVLPVELMGWVKQPFHGGVAPEGLAPVQQLLGDHLGTAPALSAYLAVNMPAPTGAAPPPPTSTSATVDNALWLCLLAPEKALKAIDTGDPAAYLSLVRQKLAGEILNLGVRSDDALCGPKDALHCPAPGTDPPRWPVRYDISTGAFSGTLRRLDKIVYQRLVVAADNTNGLNQSGTVRLRVPDAQGDGSLPFGDWNAESFATPDEDLLGCGGLPPRLDDP
jgi:hypothetical protein